MAPSLILISPGPGRPRDFGVPDLVMTAVRLGVPVFGVCLGLQGIVEAFGGELGVLDYPMHGKPSLVRHRGVGVFEGLPEEFQVGRYHSLYARRETFPACLEVTAETEDGVIMGVRHRELPIEAVQFHPESHSDRGRRPRAEAHGECRKAGAAAAGGEVGPAALRGAAAVADRVADRKDNHSIPSTEWSWRTSIGSSRVSGSGATVWGERFWMSVECIWRVAKRRPKQRKSTRGRLTASAGWHS